MNVADISRQWIGANILMSLGAHELGALTKQGRTIGLTFKARILPFAKSGKRSPRPRIMRVMIELNELDYYDIHVIYAARTEITTHYETQNIDAQQLPKILFALDYDGSEVLNSRVL